MKTVILNCGKTFEIPQDLANIIASQILFGAAKPFQVNFNGNEKKVHSIININQISAII